MIIGNIPARSRDERAEVCWITSWRFFGELALHSLKGIDKVSSAAMFTRDLPITEHCLL